MQMEKFKKVNTYIPLLGGVTGWVNKKTIHFFKFYRLYRQTS